MKIRIIEQRTEKPQNSEPQNFEVWFRPAQPFLEK